MQAVINALPPCEALLLNRAMRLGKPNWLRFSESLKKKRSGRVAQFGRAPRSQRGGRRFEPGHVHQSSPPGPKWVSTPGARFPFLPVFG